jgi:hypothetical protein
MIFEEPEDDESSKFLILSELAGFPTSQSGLSSNPKSAVAGGEQAVNKTAGETLTGWRPPRDVPNPVESQQAEFGTEPEIPVGCLGNTINLAPGKAVAIFPRTVRVLADVESGIEGEHARAKSEQQDCAG